LSSGGWRRKAGGLNSEMIIRRFDELENRCKTLESRSETIENTVNVMSISVESLAGQSRNIGSSGFRDFRTTTLTTRNKRELGNEIGDKLYATRSHSYTSNIAHVNTIMEKHPEFFEPIVARYPKFDVMMARLFVNSFGFGVGKIDASVKLIDFKDHHSEIVAKSVATLLR